MDTEFKSEERRRSRAVPIWVRFPSFKSLLLAALIGFALGVFLCWSIFTVSKRSDSNADKTINGTNYTLEINQLKQVLLPASDLISSRYHYKDADKYENYKNLLGMRVPLTTDMAVFTYEGIISAGIDLSEVEYGIDNEQGVITIRLPEIKILANEIDASSFQYPYISNSIFNNTDMQDYTKLIDKLKAEKQEELLQNTAFMDQVLKNTQLVLSSFLTASESTRGYSVVFEDL